MGIEKLYNVSIIYGIAATAITIISIFFPQLALFALVLDIGGGFIIFWDIFGSSISMKTMMSYDDFEKGFRSDLWERRLAPHTSRKDPQAVNLVLNTDGQILRIRALKRDVGLEGPLKWEGPEIAAKKSWYNLVMAKVSLDFEASTAEEGNMYLSGRSRLGRFQYLLGIDKSSRDVFFHIWDKKERARYGPPEVGSYIKERGRTHLKDYLMSSEEKEKWLILGMEWGFDGPKFFALKEGEKDFVKIPATLPPGEVREQVLKDSRLIHLFGLPEFAIRTDLIATVEAEKSIEGTVDYVKVKTAPLSWTIEITAAVSRLSNRVLYALRKLKSAAATLEGRVGKLFHSNKFQRSTDEKVDPYPVKRESGFWGYA